ncbi:hypothetical protein C8J57DRAFT_1412827 [Mycena rebaudengoi]|nr:hypothetical protein C8J57DRAFT_1412827 [Mycena rebaudengoi]
MVITCGCCSQTKTIDPTFSSSSQSFSRGSPAPAPSAATAVPPSVPLETDMAPAASARKRVRKRKRRAASSSASSSSSSSSDSETEPPQHPKLSLSSRRLLKSRQALLLPIPLPPRRLLPQRRFPHFFPRRTNPGREDAEKLMKAKFKTFWMASVADGFKDDLEEIRVKEPNLGSSRLALLIDSLASGADVFTSTAQTDDQINEMEVILE